MQRLHDSVVSVHGDKHQGENAGHEEQYGQHADDFAGAPAEDPLLCEGADQHEGHDEHGHETVTHGQVEHEPVRVAQ